MLLADHGRAFAQDGAVAQELPPVQVDSEILFSGDAGDISAPRASRRYGTRPATTFRTQRRWWHRPVRRSATRPAGSALLKTDTLYNLCTGGVAPTAVCRNGVMDTVLHPVEPLTFRMTVAATF